MATLRVLTPIIGGLVFFVFGLRLVSRSFLNLTGPYVKVGLGLLTSNRLSAVLVGTVLSFLLSSSGAATVVLVGMGSAGLLTLKQALAVTLGAAIGTSLTVQIIAFNFGEWAVYVLAVGFVVMIAGRYERTRQIGSAVFGIGVLFFGLTLMKGGVGNSVAPGSLEGPRKFLTDMAANPFYLFLMGIGLTAVFQSSATTMAVAFSFGVNVEGAVAMALGASIGTTAAGLVTGFRDGRPIARQIGVGHLLVKLVGASFFMAFLPRFTQAAVVLSLRMGVRSQAHVAANANTLFNVLNGAFFLLLLPVVEQVVLSVSGRRRQAGMAEGVALKDLERPEVALAKAHKQVVAMGRKALEMLRKSLGAFLVDAHKVTDEIVEGEETLDTWDAVLTEFLGRLGEEGLGGEADEVRNRLAYVVKDVEQIGDVISTELVELARKKMRKGVDFSMEGAHQFEKMHRMVADDLSEALDLLEGRPASGAKVLENAGRVDALRREITRSHIKRSAQGVVADVETGRIYLDAVAAVRSIHFSICDIVQVLGEDG